MLTLIHESLLQKSFYNNTVGNSTFTCKLNSLKCAGFPKKTLGNGSLCKPDGESDFGWVFPCVMQQVCWLVIKDLGA